MGNAAARGRSQGPGPLRAARRAAVLATAAAALACTVSDRGALVGRYERRTEAFREEWTLSDDGICRILREERERATSEPCEWRLDTDGGETVLAVEIQRRRGRAVDRLRYRLTPTRVPGGTITIALGPGPDAVLRKID